jgi:hypothetical protein
MPTLATPPERSLVQPVNRIAGLLPPPGKEAGRRPGPHPSPVLPLVRPATPRRGHALGGVLRAALGVPVVLGAMALLVSILVPAVLVALVLLLVGLAPLVAVGLGVLATLDAEAAPPA